MCGRYYIESGWEGEIEDIPDQYDLWKVADLFELNSHEYEIMITEK